MAKPKIRPKVSGGRTLIGTNATDMFLVPLTTARDASSFASIESLKIIKRGMATVDSAMLRERGAEVDGRVLEGLRGVFEM
ncbi:hypothetical protein FRC07_009384 [Ceratobasidium sp. 392]|nr:hypothetical protein FRC07_009384 [Ceratobasidium sp. 392]